MSANPPEATPTSLTNSIHMLVPLELQQKQTPKKPIRSFSCAELLDSQRTWGGFLHFTNVRKKCAVTSTCSSEALP